ncbi:Hypothetical_protein [Hexamita inflata]|uniref:Hypothetical_protein n=1 Tax=Hexamita inflata TaxID=28002 RepID=A0AA86RHI2_9EUKA|nr:Hypothetical protein HINF_LOCUS60397 [Hexamita inflata]
MEAKLTICTKTLKWKSNYFDSFTHILSHLYLKFQIQFTARVQQPVYTFKSRLNLGLSFLVFLKTLIGPLIYGVVHTVTNGTRPGYFQIVDASQRKAKRNTIRKKVSRQHTLKRTSAHCAIPRRVSGDRPDDERLMKAYSLCLESECNQQSPLPNTKLRVIMAKALKLQFFVCAMGPGFITVSSQF